VAEFTYSGFNASGQRRTGRLSAESRELAVISLKEQGLTPISVKEIGIRQPAYAPGLGGVSVGHLAIFTRKLATLIKTDIPISEVLSILSDEEESSFLREALDHVRERVAAGSPLGEAMADRPRVFSKLYIRMVEAGMSSGTLDLVADNLAQLFESEAALRKQLLGKLAYPIILLGFCFLAGFILRAIGFLSNEVFATILSFWAFIGVLAVFGMTKVGYAIYREIGFNLPFIGTFMRNINLARFCRILGLQYAAGVPVLQALDVSKEVLQDRRLESAIISLKREINNGLDLRDAMKLVGVFPQRVVGMVGVGERAGGVDLMLEKLAEYYELDIQTQSSIMTTVIYLTVYMIVLITGAIMVIGGYMHYYGMIGELINDT
jgi:type II secretory pathway component PulF